MEEYPPMKSRQFVLYAVVVGAFTSLIALSIFAQQDKYSVKVPGDSHSRSSRGTRAGK